ncbi:MAG: sigma-70 family RNA polymerase sigma factor [Planctomycetota bacterium]|nr:sigma-70 family RNA polymerase sigma factor [Planctomycetota bacterium]
MDEQLLVRGLRERREEVVGAFLERYRSLLFHCIGHFEADPTARDDLYQELVLYALERLDTGRFDPEKGSLGTWLYRVAWCRCVDLKRRESGRPISTQAPNEESVPDGPDPRPDPTELAGEAEIGELVHRAMGLLDTEDRRLLELRHMQGEPLAAISEHLGLSSEQCKYRLKRASTALRRVILNDLSLDRLAGEAGFLQETLKS